MKLINTMARGNPLHFVGRERGTGIMYAANTFAYTTGISNND